MVDATYIEDIKGLARGYQGIVTTSQVSAAGIPRYVLKTLLDSGSLTKIERGIYLLEGYWEDEFLIYSLRYPKGVFSFDTALYLHGLSDTSPTRFTMTFPQGYNTSSLNNALLVVRRSNESLFDLGRSQAITPSGSNVMTYNKERTLCDILRGAEADEADRSRIAFQRYCTSSEKNIALLLEYATRLRVAKRVKNYLKALL